MLGDYYTNDCIRKYVVCFGTLFNDIYVQRDAEDGSEAQQVKVPLSYGPTDKLLARVNQQASLEAPLAMVLPRLSFELVDYRYDSERKMNTLGTIYNAGKTVLNPVPYNLYFNLYLMVKNTTDATRIIEQILPYFTPDFNLPIKVLESMGISQSVAVSIGSPQVQDTFEGSIEDRRAQIWTLPFTLHGYIYGPVKDGGLIKRVEINMFDALDAAQQLSQIKIYGGQDANGHATSNTAVMVPYQNVDPTKDWSFITDINEDF